jgi:LPS export ABC transporter protein LptC
MKRSETSGHQYFFIFVFSAILLISASCERKVDQIKNLEVLNLPSQTAINFQSVITDSGRVQLLMSAPIMESYNNEEFPYTEFKSGIKAIFYDGKTEPVATVSSKYARFTNKKNLWELRDSVVVINGTNDMLETEQLFWDQSKDLIYNDRFVKISNEDQTITGTGFESDLRLTKRRIKKVSGPMYLHDE